MPSLTMMMMMIDVLIAREWAYEMMTVDGNLIVGRTVWKNYMMWTISDET